jgi:hypothetical protein
MAQRWSPFCAAIWGQLVCQGPPLAAGWFVEGGAGGVCWRARGGFARFWQRLSRGEQGLTWSRRQFSTLHPLNGVDLSWWLPARLLLLPLLSGEGLVIFGARCCRHRLAVFEAPPCVIQAK